MRRLLTAALVLGATATTATATAEQFIAAFSSNAHPAQIEVAMTQMDSNGQTLDATGLAVAPTEPNQSIAAVPMMPGAVNACVTMAPGTRITQAIAMLAAGGELALPISDDGQTACARVADPAFDLIQVQFD